MSYFQSIFYFILYCIYCFIHLFNGTNDYEKYSTVKNREKKTERNDLKKKRYFVHRHQRAVLLIKSITWIDLRLSRSPSLGFFFQSLFKYLQHWTLCCVTFYSFILSKPRLEEFGIQPRLKKKVEQKSQFETQYSMVCFCKCSMCFNLVSFINTRINYIQFHVINDIPL